MADFFGQLTPVCWWDFLGLAALAASVAFVVIRKRQLNKEQRELEGGRTGRNIEVKSGK